VCCGITIAETSDDAKSILARADSALYSAKAAGPNRMFLHTGTHIREHHAGLFQTPPGPQSDATPAGDCDGSADESGDADAISDDLVLHEAR
jgi:hypothetical protein